jgi:hypothetical protein
MTLRELAHERIWMDTGERPACEEAVHVPSCNALLATLMAAYSAGLKRAEEIARANARRWIDPETVCNDIADEIAEERHAASAGRGK